MKNSATIHYCMKPVQKPVQITDVKRYPYWIQPKYDGIRIINHPQFGWITARGKKIPNLELRSALEQLNAPHLDCEIVHPSGSFHHTQSIVMSDHHKEWSELHMFAFDLLDTRRYYCERYCEVEKAWTKQAKQIGGFGWSITPNLAKVHNEVDLRHFLENPPADKVHNEGFMLKRIYGLYKFGRCTMTSGESLKWVELEHDEAVVIGWEPEQTMKHGAGVSSIGSLIVRHDKFGDFKVGSGFDAEQRRLPYDNYWHGKVITFKHKPFGRKAKPRTPIFVGVRYDTVD